jgi:spoIIIJ-associated protein
MAEDHDSSGPGPGLSADPPAQAGLEEITSIVDLMGIDCRCSFAGREEDRLNYEVAGPDARLFSEDGPTLDALQYLAYVLVARRLGERYSISIDAEGYRERRRQELTDYARKMADEAVAVGQEAVLDPMRPHERRIVHLALRDRSDVETYSEGEEPFRRLVISPKT